MMCVRKQAKFEVLRAGADLDPPGKGKLELITHTDDGKLTLGNLRSQPETAGGTEIRQRGP